MIFEEHIGISYLSFKPRSSENLFQMSSIYKDGRRASNRFEDFDFSEKKYKLLQKCW